MFRCVVPHYRVESVLELSVERLRAMGLDALLLDVDCTLKNYRATEVQPEVAAWLESLREAGIAVCLVSNGRGQRIGRFAEKYGLPFVCKACKPLPLGCRAAIKKLNATAERTAMVGDQVFADIMAGRLAGLKSILVRPIHPEEEPWFTRLKRPWERIVLRWLGGPAEAKPEDVSRTSLGPGDAGPKASS
jgi:HAD superfamily phosphatase (TIGR01668 family)